MPYLYGEAEKFIQSTFYDKSHDRNSKLDVEKLMEEKLIADNKAKDPEYYGHRPGVIHATSVTKCLRGVVHEMLEAEKDAETEPRKLGIFQAGNLFEEYVVSALGDKVVERQREYEFKYKGLTIVGRNDGVINDNGALRIIECKSVHSDSFWYRQKEGTLIAYHNQIQLQIYMWLEREIYGRELDATLIYVSKDDCTVISAAIKYNPEIIENVVKPALDIIDEAYAKRDPKLAPVPPMTVFNEAKHQYQKNWLATYCDYHASCLHAGWVLEASNLVTQRNKELKSAMVNPHAEKKAKPDIKVVS